MSTDQVTNDPHVDRTIRTPKAVVTIRGTLDEVDRIYRTCNKALLDSGAYTIPKPGTDPWQEYKPADEPNVDFLTRRISQLEAQLRESVHEKIQELRRELAESRRTSLMWETAFTDLDNACRTALKTLQEPHELTIREAIVIEELSIT